MRLFLALLAGVLTIVIVLGLASLTALLRECIACFFRDHRAFREHAGSTMKKLEGRLEAYWETGWEGRVDFMLSVAGLDHPLPLENGQRLTIYAADGTVLWSGRLCFVKRRWWDQHKLPYGIWSDVKPAGVSYARWMEWFAHQPPLKATVEVVTSIREEKYD